MNYYDEIISGLAYAADQIGYAAGTARRRRGKGIGDAQVERLEKLHRDIKAEQARFETEREHSL